MAASGPAMLARTAFLPPLISKCQLSVAFSAPGFCDLGAVPRVDACVAQAQCAASAPGSRMSPPGPSQKPGLMLRAAGSSPRHTPGMPGPGTVELAGPVECATETAVFSPSPADVAERTKDKKPKKKEKREKVKFVKYQGLGNDFILIDNRKDKEPMLTPDDAVRMCNRNFGIGGDGVIFLLPGAKELGSQYTMRIFNNDGSEPEMCGNGIRCLARFVADLDEVAGPQRYVVSTLAGNMVLNLREDGQVRVDMGEPRLAAQDIPTTLSPTTPEGAVVATPLEVEGVTWSVTCVSMGNPHCITFSNSASPQGFDVAALPLPTIGPLFEHHPVFPSRINTEFVQVLSRTELKMRVWERGAGPTLACGTGACALVVAAVLEGRADRSCVVHLPGGPLEIEWSEEDNRIYMTGPAQQVFAGKFFL